LILPDVDRLSAVFAAENLAKERKYYGCGIPAGGFGLPPNTEVMRLKGRFATACITSRTEQPGLAQKMWYDTPS